MNSPNMQYCAPHGGEGLAEIDALSDMADGEADMDWLAVEDALKLMLADFELDGEADKLFEIEGDKELETLREIEADSDGLGPLGEIDGDRLDEIDALALPTDGEAEIEADSDGLGPLGEIEADSDKLMDRLKLLDSDGLGPEGEIEADRLLEGDKLKLAEVDALRLALGAEGDAEIEADGVALAETLTAAVTWSAPISQVAPRVTPYISSLNSPEPGSASP